MINKPIVWTIAGSDTSGGAGIQTDLHTMHALGVHGCSVVTAVTAQNSLCINDIHYLPASNVIAQINTLSTDFFPQVIKLGMLGNHESLEKIIYFLENFSGKVILDPILNASVGCSLTFEDPHFKKLLLRLMKQVYLLTPNILEASILTQHSIQDYHDIKIVAEKLLALGAKNVLIKGGHFANQEFCQDYWTDGKNSFWLASDYIPNLNCHGTGCTLSAAIAACLALGYCLQDALVIGKMYINQSISNSLTLGQGAAYLNHMGWPKKQAYLPYLTPEPILQHSIAFPSCSNIGLYPIIDSLDWLKILSVTKAKTFQLRIKNKNGENLIAELKQSIEFARNNHLQLFINDYWEYAIQFGAYGVHLGQEDLQTADIQAIRQAGLRLGISTHCYYEVARAHSLKPSYMACGPIYPTTSKIMAFQPQGIENLKCWRETLDYPLVAIGGINQQRCAEVIATGVDGIAVISAITKASDPIRATEEFCVNKSFTGDDTRYQQQLKLPEIGAEGQLLLKKAKVLCIGAGGLGSPLLLYLAACGVGNLGIVDDDRIELSNLQRQVLYKTEHITNQKTQIAKQQILALNPEIDVTIFSERFTTQNASKLIQAYDIIADCTDNADSHYLINDICFSHKKPYVFAGVAKFTGQCTVFSGTEGPCYRCLFPNTELATNLQNCNETGVIGVLPGLFGILQATEIIKWLLKIGNALQGKLLQVNLLNLQFKEFKLSLDPDCPVCIHRTIMLEETVQMISQEELHHLLQKDPNILLLDVRNQEEHLKQNIGGKLIPLNELEQRLNELQFDRTIIAYCQSGTRSLIAAKILKKNGFNNVHSLRNGIELLT